MQNREYFDSVMCDLVDVRDRDKSLLIVSSGKSTLAYETAVLVSERAGLFAVLENLRCEDGKIHEHAFISHMHSTARHAVHLIEDAKAGKITRPQLQHDLGKLLGYSMRDILGFIASAASRECPCDCCGGPFVDEKFFDSNPQPAGYAYTRQHDKTVVDLMRS